MAARTTRGKQPRFAKGDRIVDPSHGVPGTVISVKREKQGHRRVTHFYHVQLDDGGAGIAREDDLKAHRDAKVKGSGDGTDR